MDKNPDILHEAKRLRLLAAALELQHYTSTAANVVKIPGGDQVIAVGTPAQVAALLHIGPAPDELIRLGSQMSNVMFNLKSKANKPLAEAACVMLSDLQGKWDDALRTYRDAALQLLANEAQAMGGYDAPAGATDSEGGHHD